MKTRIFWLSLFMLCVMAGFVWAHEGHEHSKATGFEEFREIVAQVPLGLEGVKDMLNVHPLLVHFPIALLLGSFLFYLAGRIFKYDGLLAAGKWSLILGTAASIITVWTGLQAASTVSHGGTVHPIMMMHQYFGIGVLVLSIILSAWVLIAKSHIPQKGQPIFFLVFIVLAFGLVQGADLGGRLVFLNGVGVGKKSIVEKTQEHHGEEHEHGAHSH